jgi:thymidylate synthase
MAVKHSCKDVKDEGLVNAFPEYYEFAKNEEGEDIFRDSETGRVAAVRKNGRWHMDQVDKVIYDLKNTPFSRRIMTTIWNPEDLDEMHLQPCAYSVTFVVSQEKGKEKLTLNMILNQRSQDVLAAWAWNTCQYAVLQHMIAQVCDMEAGEFIHVDANAHIYAPRHIPAIEELIQRTPQPAPEFWLDPEIHDFYRFTKDSVALKNYVVAGEQIKNIEIAV